MTTIQLSTLVYAILGYVQIALYVPSEIQRWQRPAFSAISFAPPRFLHMFTTVVGMYIFHDSGQYELFANSVGWFLFCCQALYLDQKLRVNHWFILSRPRFPNDPALTEAHRRAYGKR